MRLSAYEILGHTLYNIKTLIVLYIQYIYAYARAYMRTHTHAYAINRNRQAIRASAEMLTIKRLTEFAVNSKTRLYVHQRICRNAPERQTAEYLRILCQNVESMYRSILFNVVLCNIGYK